jgi:D-serine deaminase-like pyridoxal phosphate-dependent protein
VASGIKDILIAHQVVGPDKISRLVNLQRHADVMVSVDSLDNVKNISQAAADLDVKVRVLVEVNIGMNRCGLTPGQAVVDLSKQIASLPGIRFAGLMGYEGHLMGIEKHEEKKRCVEEAIGLLVQSAEMVRAAGLEVGIVSTGGSGDYSISAHIPGITEIQAGGAVFTDVLYRKWGVETMPSLFIISTVVSRTSPLRAVVDAGRKAMNSEAAMPEIVGVPGAKLISTHAEHGLLDLNGPQVPVRVGDKVNFIVGYGDNTVYLHDQLYGVRKGKVELVWDIQGRGKLA